MGACLNYLRADGQLSNEAIIQVSSALEWTREYFIIFEKALQADDDLKAATAGREAFSLKVEVLKAKKETLADLDRQIAELQNRRLAIASELVKDFESGGKSCLTEHVVSVKRVE
ncbi:hypothetical protein ACFX2J_027157 [Malus domestica]